MSVYQVPAQYYFRLHHPRPRFKTDIEQVLVYLATEITLIGRKPKEEFNHDLRTAIRRYPGNLHKTVKTINNWRTEIDALFCFIQEIGDDLAPSNRAVELAGHQDLVKFFKLFCYHFQYPGGFIKADRSLDCFRAQVNFRPATYILKMLQEAENNNNNRRAGITKAEATHCIFNDLRVTRDLQDVNETWNLIMHNRELNIDYDFRGDVVRYAGDILDYLVQANLIKRQPDSKYYINHLENLAIQRFINPPDNFDFYGRLSRIPNVTLQDIHNIESEWVEYFNTARNDDFFDTDILALLTDTTEEYERLRNVVIDLDQLIEDGALATTGRIGSVGESLVLNHEKIHLTNSGREDLIHLVNIIPTYLAIGYDINSREIDERHRKIEVKTTASSTPIQFSRFHLTPNEWSAADTDGEHYFVYRLMVTRGNIKLFVIKDPVGEYRRGNIRAVPRNGMDIFFDPTRVGEEIQLLM